MLGPVSTTSSTPGRFASGADLTPAALLGLADRGAIAVGRRADLVALDADLSVESVWVRGEKAWSRQ